ncbi:MAG TPA: helix-turn-helix domain-containing protein [Solirubrobacteraceae bacterium]|nr:helix-turn-helix domain-containing protein [Solirubrobacteraceae bacterium]
MATASQPATPKGAATRAFLLQTAAEVFAERGYADTTMAELIARSGLTKGAFYFHFASKEQLALAVIDEKQRQWLASVETAVGNEPTALARLRALGPALVRLHREDPSAFSVSRLARDLARVPGAAALVRGHMRSWVALVAALIAHAQADGDLPGDIDPGDTAAVLVAAADGLKDLSDLIDPPGRARRGYERRMAALARIVDALTETAARH